MLPKKHRLTLQEFYQNPQNVRKYQSPMFSFLVKPTISASSRFTIVVPKSLDKRSTRRNRTKRIIREIIKQKMLNNVKSKIDVLIKPKKIINIQNPNITEELITVFNKAQL